MSRRQNPHYYDLIQTFAARSGTAVVLNTSFNENEPAVDTPPGPELLASYRANTAQHLAVARDGSRNYGLRILEFAVAANLDEQQADAALQRRLEQLIQVPPARNP
jgi:hypothetical protein